MCDSGKNVCASYQFEIAVSVRGHQWQIHRRSVRENSAIFRQFDELFPKTNGARAPDRKQSPHLFSGFLDPKKSVRKDSSGEGSVSFALDLNVQVPDYEVDGALFLKQHYEGGYIYRDLIIIEAFPDSTAPAGIVPRRSWWRPPRRSAPPIERSCVSTRSARASASSNEHAGMSTRSAGTPSSIARRPSQIAPTTKKF